MGRADAARWIVPPAGPLEGWARAAVGAALALIALSVLMVYSASSVKAGLKFDDAEFFLRRQLVWALLGAATLWICMRSDPEVLRRWARPAGIAVLVLLAAVLVVGTEANGARRWFRMGPLSLQPSEIAKLAAVVWLAHHLDAARDRLSDWKQGVLPAVAPVGIAAALTIVEPDFGTALFLFAVGAAVMLVGGVPVRRLAWCGLAALPLLAWQVYERWGVMMRRLQGMGGDASPASHQVWQSKVAMGSGGLMGVGVGAGKQKLFYLPEAHTDFILGVIGEELGFLGTMLVVALFVVIVWCGLKVAMGVADRSRYAFLLVFGVIFMIGLQAAGNVAVVTGSVPTKGIALPFVSLGGSSLLVLCAALGFVYAAARRHDLAAARAAGTAGRPEAAGGDALPAGGAA
ncbi:MAG: putative peptidoglycan glycosyltransferase FtsW [Planctomycetes bacterium]|nr:putative peptidoglycan glycosyltransferase FtsW [Planctomycetota bacterium]